MALAMDFGRPESDKCQFNEHASRIANIHKHHINLIGVIRAIDKTSKQEQPLARSIRSIKTRETLK